MRVFALFRVSAVGALLTAALVGCSGLPSVPSQPVRYDLGVPPPVQDAKAATAIPVLALADIQSRTQHDASTAVLYRLAYADGQALQAYGQARWSQPPALLVQQRMREILGQGRTVLSAESGVLPPLVQGRPVPVLQLSLEEFSHTFTSAEHSAGVLRLRATLIAPQRSGDILLGQQLFAVQQPAASANAAGGTQALAQAVAQVGAQLQQWLDQLTPP